LILLWLFGLLAAAFLAVCAVVYWRQEAMLFFPEPLAPQFRFGLPPDVEELSIPVQGARLSALHLRLPDPKCAVLFLHGNGGSLRTWFVDTGVYRRANCDLFMIDYRGYGKSTGRIASEEQLHADVFAAWQAMRAVRPDCRAVILGRSLGTALAARLASQVQPAATILVSPYWSMGALARLHYPVLPGFLLRYPLETFRDIAAIRGPVLLLHGDRDELIPISQSERLQALSPRVLLVPVREAGHNDLQDFPAYEQEIADFLGRV
jgi:pimeloyl-ACP methyl ester carboxylesterase